MTRGNDAGNVPEHPEDELHSGLDEKFWLVHKFGGTSVANADCFRKVATIIENQVRPINGKPQISVAAVVSAMGGKPKTTDLLLKTVSLASERKDVEETLQFITDKHRVCLQDLFPTNAEECERLLTIITQDLRDISDILKTVALMKWQASRISELVSGYGELWSAQILTALLRQRQVEKGPQSIRHEFVYLDARRLIIVDEESIQTGAIDWERSQANMTQVYAEEMAKVDPSSEFLLHFVMTGYVATNTQGVATTLQRDGSDYSASIFGRLLQAVSISIWTDVNGVLTADPRRVPKAQVVGEISFNEAMELAYFGAKVIHPKTMQPAISATPYQIPIYIRNTFEPAFPGTRIFATSTRHADLDKVVCGFSSVEDIALINVEGSGLMGVPGVAKRLFSRLEENNINVVLISQASSEHTITFATVAQTADVARAAIEDEFSRELRANHISSVDVIAPCSVIAAVGDGMAHTTGVASRFFSALGDAKINILAVAQGSSERNISAVVLAQDSTRALRAVHAAFRLSHTTIRVGIVGMNELGKSLLRLLDTQRDNLRSTFDLELQVCALLPKVGSEVIELKEDLHDGGTESIGYNDFDLVMEELESGKVSGSKISFSDEKIAQVVPSSDLSSVQKILSRSEYTNRVIFDCTNDEDCGKNHSAWLAAGVNVVTANNTGLSGPKKQRDEIDRAEKALGKQSAQYLREVTVGGGLPIISTMRSLLQSGDRIRFVDGIMSVSLSFIMFRISPPANFAACGKFDELSSQGAFRGDLHIQGTTDIGQACSFSQAVKEAIDLGLMEEDPTKDFNNEYTSRLLMVLAKELGIVDLELDEIMNTSERAFESIPDFDYRNITDDVDAQIKKRVDDAKSRGCVLRHVAHVDVKQSSVGIKLMEVPEHHVFAVNPPSCECVRFFTHRHMAYPLTIQGPAAGADSTASALLAELLQMMRGKSSPRSVALSRSGSSASLRNSASVGVLPNLSKQ